MQPKFLFKKFRGFTINYSQLLLVVFLLLSHTLRSQAFVYQSGTSDPFQGLYLGAPAATAFGDFDNDWDLDLVLVGEVDNKLHYLRNDGTFHSPKFVYGGRPFVEYSGIFTPVNHHLWPTTGVVQTFYVDLVVGSAEGKLLYFKNNGIRPPMLAQQLTSPFDGLSSGLNAAPLLADFDGYGDVDLLLFTNGPRLDYYRNDRHLTSNRYVKQTGAANPFNGFASSLLGPPTAGDLDKDGDLDVIMNGYFFLNIGTKKSPKFTLRTDYTFLHNLPPYVELDKVTLADLDADGDADLIVGNNNGTFQYFKNVMQTASQSIASQTPAALDLSNIQPANAEKSAIIKLYPNPTKGKFIMELHLKDKITSTAKFELVNMIGQTVCAGNANISDGILQKDIYHFIFVHFRNIYGKSCSEQ